MLMYCLHCLRCFFLKRQKSSISNIRITSTSPYSAKDALCLLSLIAYHQHHLAFYFFLVSHFIPMMITISTAQRIFADDRHHQSNNLSSQHSHHHHQMIIRLFFFGEFRHFFSLKNSEKKKFG